MSSSRDAGYYADQALKTKDEKCKSPQAKNGAHKWIRRGLSPSAWEVCEHCGKTVYFK